MPKVKTKDYEETTDEAYIPNPERDRALETACKMFKTGVEFQQPRFEQILKNEEMVEGKTAPALKGRNNVPFDSVIMSGFKQTLMSKIDEPLQVEYGKTNEQDKKPAEKMTAVFDVESAADRENWEAKDLDGKGLGAASGRIFFKIWGENVPKFATHLEVVDHFDMVTEPQGGRYLDKHLFKFQQNIFRSEAQMMTMAANGFYDAGEVEKLKNRSLGQDSEFKRNEDLYKNKVSRMQALGLNIEMNDYVGNKMHRLVEGIIYFEGKWRYIVFSYEYKCCLRFELLENVFGVAKEYAGRGCWVSWATETNAFNFWSKAPLDDIRPIAVSMKKIFNLMLDNLEKRNWDMKVVDQRLFSDISKLRYKEDGIVGANLSKAPGLQSVSQGIYKFETPDTTNITINLFEYLNNFIGEKSGVTPGAQGSADEQKVGIYFGNLEQVADRFNLTNKMYRQAYVDLGVCFKYAVYDNLREPYAVKIIGNSGVEWDEELTRADAGKHFRVTVRGGGDEEKRNALLSQKKDLALTRILGDQRIAAKVNEKWLLREILETGGYDKEVIKTALDPMSEDNQDLMSEAAQAIEDIVTNGRTPKLNRGANTAFIRKINDYVTDMDLKPEQKRALMDYAIQHIPVARYNMVRKAEMVKMAQEAMMISSGAGGPVAGQGAGGAPMNGQVITDNPVVA